MQENSKTTTATLDAAPTRETGAETTDFTIPKITAATDEQILAYLHYACRLAELATAAEEDALVLALCEQLNITVSDEEWQAAGDTFRMEHNLLSPSATIDWLREQRISVEAWSEGIKIQLLKSKLREHLFGGMVDSTYFADRDRYRRVALSQILVVDLATALTLVRQLREEHASFCALALEYSKGKQSQTHGGFAGVHFFTELLPEIMEALSSTKEGEIVGPVKTQLGYHILRVEKWYPIELDEATRNQILNVLFQAWIQELDKTHHEKGIG